MHPVIFIVATIFLSISFIVTILGLNRISKNDIRGRLTLLLGYVLWVISILVTAILFVGFSL
jgi:hypothetical protein